MARALVAGVELGGTKCICILGTGPEDVRDEVRIPTTEPEATLSAIEEVLGSWLDRGDDFDAIGIASFGPIQLDTASPLFGHITSTAKRGWLNTDVANRIHRRFGMPVAFDTDVNGAALAEGRWGAAQGLDDYAYVTVGTGVGVGLVTGGRPIHGLTHAELGHVRVVRQSGDDWIGSCPYHGACIEGLASGTAIEARLGLPADELDSENPVWPLVAHTLGQLMHILVATGAPRRIMVGGGVMSSHDHLFQDIRREALMSLNGYITVDQIEKTIEDFIIPPALNSRAGPLGALALALDPDPHQARFWQDYGVTAQTTAQMVQGG
jgi:fructokinase